MQPEAWPSTSEDTFTLLEGVVHRLRDVDAEVVAAACRVSRIHELLKGWLSCCSFTNIMF